MRVLLDTHVVLWWLSDDPALGDDIKGLLDAEPDAYVSAATLWEISIKQALGKLGPADLAERVRDAGFRELPMTMAHALVAGRLPEIHRDPFDRMLVAQAQCEDLTLVTRDEYIHKYDVLILSA
jgi:PIN domain nuclease of toxin-antitoxin system